MKCIKMEVYGLVQGVGFRFSTKQLADSLGIKGIVMNRNDGSVYIEAEGTPLLLQEFIDKVKLSPSPSGHVDHYIIKEISQKNYSDFSIVYE
nr:acylphosphatase [Ligilactobacillus cholophilus]